MIDWYLILFLFAAMVVFNLEKIADPSARFQFLHPSQRFGIQQGIVLIWISFFTQTYLVIPIYCTFHFGYLWSLFFLILFLFLTLICIHYLPWHVQERGQNCPVLLKVYENRLSPAGFKLGFFLLLIANLDGLMLQLSFARRIFEMNFQMSPALFTGLAALFCLIIAGLGGIHVMYRTGYAFLLICGFILLFVPLFFFLREGIHHIYQHYSMVIPHTKNMVLLVAALFMAFIGMLSVHVFLWQVLCSIKQNYRNSTIRLSLLCFSGVPLSIMLYTVYLMSKFRISTFTGLGHAIFSFPPPFIRSMIIIVWLFSIMNTVMFSVYALAVMLAFLFERKAMLQKRKNFFITLLLIVSLCVLVQFGIGSNVKYLWKIYFLYYVAISLPFYALLVGKKKRTILLPFSVLVVAICGGATGILLRNFYAALAVTAVGAFIVGLAVMLTRKSKDLIK